MLRVHSGSSLLHHNDAGQTRRRSRLIRNLDPGRVILSSDRDLPVHRRSKRGWLKRALAIQARAIRFIRESGYTRWQEPGSRNLRPLDRTASITKLALTASTHAATANLFGKK